MFSANLDGVWDELGRLFLGKTRHVFQQYGYLVMHKGRDKSGYFSQKQVFKYHTVYL